MSEKVGKSRNFECVLVARSPSFAAKCCTLKFSTRTLRTIHGASSSGGLRILQTCVRRGPVVVRTSRIGTGKQSSPPRWKAFGLCSITALPFATRSQCSHGYPRALHFILPCLPVNVAAVRAATSGGGRCATSSGSGRAGGAADSAASRFIGTLSNPLLNAAELALKKLSPGPLRRFGAFAPRPTRPYIMAFMYAYIIRERGVNNVQSPSTEQSQGDVHVHAPSSRRGFCTQRASCRWPLRTSACNFGRLATPTPRMWHVPGPTSTSHCCWHNGYHKLSSLDTPGRW